MRRLHHSSALVGILSAAFGSATVWWLATLEAGGVVEVTGTAASPLLWSIGAVSLAAYGLQFTLRGFLRRGVGGLQAITALAFAGVALSIAANPLSSTLSGITEATGVAGSNALLLVDSFALTGWHWSAVLAGALLAISGGAALMMPDRAHRVDRFERRSSSGSLEDSVSAWDSLSEGEDPTHR
jgi:hypothetical protein